MEKNKDGCYCPETGDFGQNSDMMTVCFNCGLVIETMFIDTGDEINRYEDSTEQSRCNGFTKTSYLSYQNNLSLSFKNNSVSSYSQNFIKWSSFTNDDIIMLKIKDLLERKSHEFSLSRGHITFILNRYKKLLEIKKKDKNINFKGKYTKGILAVFAFVAMKPISKEKVCEMFDIKDDFPLFNKCCKLHKDIFKEDVNFMTSDCQNFSEILDENCIPFKIKDLIEKGYTVLTQFNVFSNIYNKKIMLTIILFFLEELDYDTTSFIDENNSYFKSKFHKENKNKLDIIKYQIFNEIKKISK